MLILTRKAGESFTIGDEVRVFVLEVRAHLVRIGIEAPRDMVVYRDERLRQVQAGQIPPGEILAVEALASKAPACDLPLSDLLLTDLQSREILPGATDPPAIRPPLVLPEDDLLE
jgi:carbon storage regulator